MKRFTHAKRRLATVLCDDQRRELAEAMFRDVLTALRGVAAIDEVVVVSADPSARRIAEGWGARALADPLLGGQNESIVRGTVLARDLGATLVLCVSGDCPLVAPSELAALIDERRAHEPLAGIVTDRHGTGTNGLLLSPPDAFEPRYGPGSAARHLAMARAAGLPTEVVPVASLALDIDTPDDLTALREELAARRDGAEHTRAMLRCIGATPETAYRGRRPDRLEHVHSRRGPRTMGTGMPDTGTATD